MQRLCADHHALSYSFDPRIEPRLTVGLGETFVVETEDAFTGRLGPEDTIPTPEFMPEMESVPARFNPVTGPVYVEGVKAGDTLVVKIERVEPAAQGVTALIEGMGNHGSWSNWELFNEPRRFTTTHEPGPDGSYENGSLTVDGYSGPLAPLVGTIGVAPEYVAESTRMGQGPHGGVWDHRFVTSGTAIYFPVFHDGGLLSLGDMHAVQGDCEFFGVADEVRGEVQLTCDVISGERVSYPRMETEDKLIQIYCSRPLEQAVRSATRLLLEWLVEDYGITERQAYWLVAVNPEFTVTVGLLASQLECTVTAELSRRSVDRALESNRG